MQASGSSSKLSAHSLRFGYGNEGDVLCDLDLEVAPAEIYALLGGNGAGKSTLIQLALGLRAPRAGAIQVDGLDPWRDPAGARQTLAYVPENVVVYEQLTGFENLRYFLQLAGQGDLPDQRLNESLAEAGLKPEAWNRRSGEYSKGMRQKLALALATARQASLLLLDEPTSGLDPTGIEEFHRMLLAMKARGVSTLLVTHDLLGASTVADRLGFLAAGRIQREITAEGRQRFDLIELRSLYLGGVRPAPEDGAVAVTAATGEVDPR